MLAEYGMILLGENMKTKYGENNMGVKGVKHLQVIRKSKQMNNIEEEIRKLPTIEEQLKIWGY